MTSENPASIAMLVLKVPVKSAKCPRTRCRRPLGKTLLDRHLPCVYLLPSFLKAGLVSRPYLQGTEHSIV